ncbi:hypothetical protein UFOVP1015_20 [uncultured Caudovirales phage]|uniref:Uncharacterized protein n=3 Tax=uncultured Caudovirales phage TaxID=2100421 RepID=A0A6J5Q0U5_9CAUD|nr:hypothetical protein UFOVP1015_20 [uncultured Caudovirales phage]
MITLSAIVTSIKSRVDKSWSITFSTPELNPSQMMDLGSMNGKECVLGINLNAFSQSEEKLIDEIKVEDADMDKSPSKRLRAVIFLRWKDNNEGYNDFNLYYSYRMEKHITNEKNQLPPR